MPPHIVVIGATGDVGRGIVAEALAREWTVIAVARNRDRLQALSNALGAGESLAVTVGSVADEAAAAELLTDPAVAAADAVVTTVNVPSARRALLDRGSTEIRDVLAANLIPHFAAAKTFLPALPSGSVYLAIGGGMADHVFTGSGPISMVQAAQRMMFRALAKENPNHAVHLRELIVASLVNGESNRATADPKWLTDREIGHRVCEIIADPHDFPGPVLTMTGR